MLGRWACRADSAARMRNEPRAQWHHVRNGAPYVTAPCGRASAAAYSTRARSHSSKHDARAQAGPRPQHGAPHLPVLFAIAYSLPCWSRPSHGLSESVRCWCPSFSALLEQFTWHQPGQWTGPSSAARSPWKRSCFSARARAATAGEPRRLSARPRGGREDCPRQRGAARGWAAREARAESAGNGTAGARGAGSPPSLRRGPRSGSLRPRAGGRRAAPARAVARTRPQQGRPRAARAPPPLACLPPRACTPRSARNPHYIHFIFRRVRIHARERTASNNPPYTL